MPIKRRAGSNPALGTQVWALSSAAEHRIYIPEVRGSNPLAPIVLGKDRAKKSLLWLFLPLFLTLEDNA